MSFHTGPDRIVVVVPAFNEQAAIRRVVMNVLGVLPDADVLVIDDGSSDATADEAGGAGAIVLRHPFNLGIGAAVQTGLKFAIAGDYQLVVRVDGDGQHDQASISSLITAMREQRADAVFGSRFLGQGADMPISRVRRVGIAYFAALVTLLAGERATDTTSGFCCLNRRAIELLARYMPQDYPEVESRLVMHKAGLRVVEVAVPMWARVSGVSSINRWRSIYYAAKVTVAALMTALKDIPSMPEELAHVDSVRTTGHSYPLQYPLAAGDHPADPSA